MALLFWSLPQDLYGLGGSSDNIELDNIQFSQSAAIPESSTLLLGSGLFGLAGAGYRRRRG
ncbi:MAG: hypothetical protein AABY87_03730 [bacterium]